MNIESLNIIKGIVDSDLLHPAKTITQENLALNGKNEILSLSNKNLKSAIFITLAIAGVYGLYYLYQKNNDDKKQHNQKSTKL